MKKKTINQGDLLNNADYFQEIHWQFNKKWIQVNCSLFPQTHQQDDFYCPWADLSSLLDTFIEHSICDSFFFVRKPPGIRMRFSNLTNHLVLHSALATWLNTAEKSNTIRGYRFSHYEPESHRFGRQGRKAQAHGNRGAQANALSCRSWRRTGNCVACPRDGDCQKALRVRDGEAR